MRSADTYAAAGDGDLARQCLAGSLDAFDELVRRHQQAVLRLCRRMLRDDGDAEDASQESFVRAYERLHLYDADRDFAPWLLSVTSRVCLNRLRRPAPRPVSELEREDGPSLLEGLADESTDPEQLAVGRDFQRAVANAIDDLPETYRLVLHMRFEQQMSYEQICAALSMPMGTVKTHIHRARKLLVERLDARSATN